MNISRDIKVWAEKTTICIAVNSSYTYYAKINSIGSVEDNPNLTSMWSWINHLKNKRWWNSDIQRSFVELSFIMEKLNKFK